MSDTNKTNQPLSTEISEVKKGEGVTSVPLESSPLGPIRQPRFDGAGVTAAPSVVEPQAPAAASNASNASASPTRVLTVPSTRPTKGSNDF